ASAKKYLAQNDSKAAVIQLKNALQQNPDLAEARFLLGKSLLDSGNPGGAAIELGKASDLKYPPEQVAPALARALLAQGQARKVIENYAATTLATPATNADLKTSLALAYASQRDNDKARAALDAALQAEPDYLPALLVRSRDLASRQDLDGAFKVLDQALAKAPDDVDALQWKGDLLLYGRKDEAAAIAAYKRVLEVRKDSPVAHASLLTIDLSHSDLAAAKAQLEALQKVRPADPQTKYFEARVAFLAGDLKHAGELVEQLQKAAPNNLRVLQLAGAIAFQKGSLLQAEQLLGQTLQAAPGLEPVRLLLAKTYMRAGDPAKALATVLPLLDSAAPSAETLALAGSAYLETGDLDHAEKLFARAVKLDPKDARSRTALAVTHLSRDNGDAAFGQLQSIADSDAGISADMVLITANLQRKNFDAALKAIDGLEKKQPDKPLAPNLRGRVLLMRGDFDGARKNFDKAVALDPVYFAAIESLAALDLRDKKPEAARQRFDKLLEREPKNARALLALAQLRALSGGHKDEVLALINKAVNLNPTEVAPRLALVNYQLDIKDSKGALAAAQAADAALPNTPQLLDALARSHLAGGDVNQAINTYGKLAAMQPNSPQPQIGLADAYVVAKNNDAAEQSLKRALVIAPSYLPAQQKLIALQMAMGKPDAALVTAREVQTQRADAPVGFVYQGDIEASRKNWKAAEAAYRTAQQKGPATDVASKLHTVLRVAGRRADADALAAAWLKQHPQDTLFLFHLGNVALAENDFTGAEARFEQLLKLQPDNAFAHNNLAWTLAKLKHDGALDHAEKANSLMPNQPAFMDTLATLLADSGKFKEAIDLQKKVVELQPADNSYRLNLAKIYIKSGDKTLARSELERLAQLGDKFPAQKEVHELQGTL
ncbi:MAG: XrtA/PEP-CTERM system TPR-repeat protein PrsT, partial [Caldimonas sp.]